MLPAWSHFVERLRQVWVEDPADFARFARPAGTSLLMALDELGSQRMLAVLIRFGREIGKSILRGLPAVGVVCAALFFGARAVGSKTGELGRPVLESYVILVLLRDGLPLGVALFVAVRQGSSLTAKFALERGPIGERQRTLAPYLVSATLAAVVFYLALAWFLLFGYLRGGPLMLTDLQALDALLSDALRNGYLRGIAKSALFGFLVAYTSMALGWYANLDALVDESTRRHPIHYLLWESASWALSACVMLTPVFNRPLEGTPW